MSKYKDVFNARKLEKEESGNRENQKAGEMEIQKNGNLEGEAERNKKMVNLGIKVAESRRRFWVGQAKLQGITISEIIIGTLSKKFGEPE